MKILPLVCSVLLLGTAVSAQAGPAATLVSPGLNYGATAYTIGFLFTLGANTSATKLGVYDSNGDGLETNAQVGLWTSTGTLLGSVTVGAATAGELIGTFRYADITPIALSAGSSYIVGSYMGDGLATSFNVGYGGSGSFDPIIVFAQDRVTAGYVNTLVFPGASDLQTGGMWAGGNVFFAVPEPASWAMLIAGFGLTGAAMRRRRALAPVS